MASSITHPNLSFTNRLLPRVKRPFCPSTYPLCRCSNSSSSSSSDNFSWRWDAALNDLVRGAIKRFDSHFNSSSSSSSRRKEVEKGNKEVEEEEEQWDWDRWKLHFLEVDDRERLVSLLKSQLGHAIHKEDYEDAARLKVAIAAAARNDTVGEVMAHLNRAIAEERYWEAAFLRDNAGAGLVGWWSGISEDAHDPYGLIIHITAEHGRYVARSFSPRQLATASSTGIALFEIFLTINKKGDYRQQAVYLKRKVPQDLKTGSGKAAASRLNPPGPTEEKSDILVVSTEETEDTDVNEDGSDVAEELPGFQNILQDMVPGVKVKVLKVTAPAKVDKDFISKVIEQIMDEEDEEQNFELESSEAEDEGRDESNNDKDEIKVNSGNGEISYSDDKNEISVKVVVGGLGEKISGNVLANDSFRVPARLEKKGCKSFSFSVEKDINQLDSGSKKSPLVDRKSRFQGQHTVDSVMSDIAKFMDKEKIPLKVLKDVGELISLTLSQVQSRQPLSGTTTFHRIEIPSYPDPLSGLYLGAHGLYSSEVICLQRKFGQWQDDLGPKKPSNLEFYEYVEAVKLTGDPYVPAGQVAFRARVGKQYQLPHKGIIPEELGVIARYKGQGRLAEPGFQNPRWVDGELVILDGKYIKGGPVVGFVYWAPEYHFLVFFNRLRLQ